MKKAFTMLELVFVIVVLGLLTALLFPRLEADPLRDAANQVIRHLRYTQHLAMSDDQYDVSNPTWFRERWRMRMYTVLGTVYTAVFQDTDENGNIDTVTHTEPALDPLTHKYLFDGAPAADTNNNAKMDLTDSYGITALTSTCNRAAKTTEIFYDEMGRPYSDTTVNNQRPYFSPLIGACAITLTHTSGRTAVITVEPETGYAWLSAIN